MPRSSFTIITFTAIRKLFVHVFKTYLTKDENHNAGDTHTLASCSVQYKLKITSVPNWKRKVKNLIRDNYLCHIIYFDKNVHFSLGYHKQVLHATKKDVYMLFWVNLSGRYDRMDNFFNTSLTTCTLTCAFFRRARRFLLAENCIFLDALKHIKTHL